MNITNIIEQIETPRSTIKRIIQDWATLHKKTITKEQEKVLLSGFTAKFVLTKEYSGLNTFEWISKHIVQDVDMRQHFKNATEVQQVLWELGVLAKDDYKSRITTPVGEDLFYMIGTAIKRR